MAVNSSWINNTFHGYCRFVWLRHSTCCYIFAKLIFFSSSLTRRLFRTPCLPRPLFFAQLVCLFDSLCTSSFDPFIVVFSSLGMCNSMCKRFQLSDLEEANRRFTMRSCINGQFYINIKCIYIMPWICADVIERLINILLKGKSTRTQRLYTNKWTNCSVIA